MLGRLRMSVDQCEEAYLDLSRRIFKSKRTRSNFLGKASDLFLVNGKFNTDELETTIKEVVSRNSSAVNTPLLEDSESPPCRV